MAHSYKEQVTTEHDAFCMGASLTSALENARDAGDFTITLDAALENAYAYLAEGMQHCRCMFAAMTGDKRIDYLLQFSDSALDAMHAGGYFNDSTGEVMKIDSLLRMAVHNTRTERNNHWEAEFLANEIVGDQNSYNAIVASDTEPQASYSLQVNGLKSPYGSYVNKWGIAYAVVRELQVKHIDPEANTGFIAAVLGTLDSNDSVSTSGLEFSTTFESN